MAQLLGAASGSKNRRAGEEGEGFETAAAQEEDRISALPEEMRLQILALLPLKWAIRTGALSTRWRALWARRWPAPSSLDLHIRPGDDSEELLRSLVRHGRRRLDCFSLTIHPFSSRLPPCVTDPQRFLRYAVACGVEDLHIDAVDHSLSLGSCSDAFPTLEVVHLQEVGSVDISRLLRACPRLKTLVIRHCNCERVINLTPHLRSLTVADCNLFTHINGSTASGLRSFRLSSARDPTYCIAATVPLEDLYISLRGQNCNPIRHWIRALPDLANLRESGCSPSAALPSGVYALDRFGSATCLTKLSYLPSLRELQLVMLEMDYTNLAHMYVFFRRCQCPQLERLFVQLPSSSHDISTDISLEVSQEDEPDEELNEDDDPDEEEDEPIEELSEGYEAEEELLLEQLSEECMLQETLYYGDVYDEDLPEENVPKDEQSEKDVPEGEQSEEDVPEGVQSEEDVKEGEQSEDDVLLYGLNNLIFAELMKFKGHYFEMRLVSFLLRRATGLQKLLLVPPVGVGNCMEAQEEPLDTSCFLETKLNFEKASPDAQVVLSDSDPAAIQPVHSDVF